MWKKQQIFRKKKILLKRLSCRSSQGNRALVSDEVTHHLFNRAVGRSEIWGARSNLVGIVCPPLLEIGLIN